MSKDNTSLNKVDINETVREAVVKYIKNGLSISNIIVAVKSIYNCNISQNTIKKYQFDELDSLYDEVKKIPHGDTAKRLIKLFESMNDVSFVYVKHNFDSGFVTHQKLHWNPHNVSNYQKCNDSFASEKNEIKAWRDSLSLGTTNDILVSFAWSHDEELRKIQQFPEFLSCDTTFGTNKQRRNLFVVSLVDGRNKQSNVMKVFMP